MSRRCARADCVTILSTSNDGPFCFAHSHVEDPPHRMRYHGQEFGHCLRCDTVKERRYFAHGQTICNACAQKAARAAAVRVCGGCGEAHPETAQYRVYQDGAAKGVCRGCRNRRRREKYAAVGA